MSEQNGSNLVLQVFALFTVILLSSVSMMPPLPARIVPFWEEDSCMWFDGEIVSKRIENEGLVTANYIFVVNGTLDNETDIQMEVHGDIFFYELLPIGSYYNGTICDTVPLRQAVIDGVIKFIS
mgnify:CR=1 FL=1